MEILEKQNIIETQTGERSISYLLKDNEIFSSLGFKTLLAAGDKGLLECVKINFNGQIKLIYLTQEYRRLDQILSILAPDRFLRIAVNLIGNVLQLRENSFLKSSCLELSSDRIFVDWNTCNTYLICLPVSHTSLSIPDVEIDNRLRRDIIGWIKQEPALSNGNLNQLLLTLGDYSCDLAQVYQKFQLWGGNAFSPEKKKVLTLSCVEPGSEVHFKINKGEYILGKSITSADGCIKGNPYIGRRHCKIIHERTNWYAVDMESKNGTWLDNKKLTPGNSYQLSEGSILKLANMSFIAEWKEEES